MIDGNYYSFNFINVEKSPHDRSILVQHMGPTEKQWWDIHWIDLDRRLGHGYYPDIPLPTRPPQFDTDEWIKMKKRRKKREIPVLYQTK